jgi:hypothetical protein
MPTAINGRTRLSSTKAARQLRISHSGDASCPGRASSRLACSPSPSARLPETGQTAFYAEVNECRPSPSFVCVELAVSENNGGDETVTLRYFVHDINFAMIYVPQTNLIGIPRSMFTVSKDERTVPASGERSLNAQRSRRACSWASRWTQGMVGRTVAASQGLSPAKRR